MCDVITAEEEPGLSMGETSKRLAELWKALSDDDKKTYQVCNLCLAGLTAQCGLVCFCGHHSGLCCDCDALCTPWLPALQDSGACTESYMHAVIELCSAHSTLAGCHIRIENLN